MLTIAFLAAITSCTSPATNVVADNRSEPTTKTVVSEQPSANRDVGLINEPAALPTPEPVQQVNIDPLRLTKAFYEFYLEGFPGMEGNEVSFSRFLTSKFYNEAEKIDAYDPFFDVPEFGGTFKDLKFSQAVITGNKATVDVMAKAQSGTWIVKVSLVKKNGAWKIDGVKHDLKG